MKKIFAICLLVSILSLNVPAFAATQKGHASTSKQGYTTCGRPGKVTLKSVGAGALSLLIWPGIGQLMNDDKNTEKVLVHAVLGLTGVFRIWSCYDGVVDRKGGVWDNRI